MLYLKSPRSGFSYELNRNCNLSSLTFDAWGLTKVISGLGSGVYFMMPHCSRSSDTCGTSPRSEKSLIFGLFMKKLLSVDFLW